MSQNEVWILSAARTPIGSFLGGLSSFTAPQLGAKAISAAISRAKISTQDVNEVIMGCVLTSAMGQAPARQAALAADIPVHVPATTVGKVCGSGLKSIMLGAQAIQCGDAEVVVAGGMESMTNTPYALPKARQGLKFGHAEFVDTMIKDGLWDVYNNFHMGNAAELCSRECSISREDQDAFATQSYQRAQSAIKAGYFEEEITPIEVLSKKNEKTFIKEDEEPFKANFEKFSQLKGAFEKDGTVTAANASSLNDGAAAVILASSQWAKAKGLSPLGIWRGHAQAARKPEWFTLAPIDSLRKLSTKLNWDLDSVDLFEINEAFSVVSLACMRELKLSQDKVNVYGGAVALGHPIGASGARILVTLLHTMKRLNKKKGMASLCIGGGEAVAAGVER